MTIQISVLLWTVICFLLMMLILNRLLFKPLLAVMDAREQRIAQAKARKQEFNAAQAAALEAHRLAEAKFREEKTQEAAQAIAALQAAQAQTLAAAQARYDQALDTYDGELSLERAALTTELDRGREALAHAFVDRLVS